MRAVITLVDDATFYPPLPENIIEHSTRLKTLRYNDAGINNAEEALIILKTTNSDNKNQIYRTRDGGKNWFKVYDFVSSTSRILDITPVHLYKGDNAYKPGFSMLLESNGQYKLLNQDTFHGF
jgi:hypothetical protein